MQAAGNSLFAFRRKQNSNGMPTAGAVSHLWLARPTEKRMNKHRVRLRRMVLISLVSISATRLRSSGAVAQELTPDPAPVLETAPRKEILPLPPGTLIPVDLDIKNWNRVHNGDTVEGHLALPVCATQQVVIPEGAAARVTIQTIERVHDKTGTWKTIGRGIIKAFNPVESADTPEYLVKLKAVELISPNGQAVPITAQVLRAAKVVTVRPEERGSSKSVGSSGQENSSQNPKEARSRMLLRLGEAVSWPAQVLLLKGKSNKRGPDMAGAEPSCWTP